MASSHGYSHSETAKMEQIRTEFFAKSLHIILESRVPYMSSCNFSGEQVASSPSSSSSSSPSVRLRDKWFNLALRECPAALENIDLWRQGNLELMVIDIILVKRPLNRDPMSLSPKRDLPRNISCKERYPFCLHTDQEGLGFDAKSEKIIERWVVQYESRKNRDCNSGSRRSSNSTLHTLYKKSTLFLRSLYATVRLLPAYKVFRDLNSSSQLLSFLLAHRVSSFVEPFTHKEEAEMQRFGFTHVDTPTGRLCLSVYYRSSVSDVSSEPSTPVSPQVIPDYVGSPLADPLRRFPSLPVAGSWGSPSSLPFSRRHSWSYDHYRASPPSVTYSPSPTHSETHASVSNARSRHCPPSSLPPHPPDTSSVHKQNTSFDEYFPFPNMSPSLSPSHPIHIPGSNLSKELLRSESAPVGIPPAKFAHTHGVSDRHNLPPSPPFRTSKYTSKIDEIVGLMQTGPKMEKSFSLGKDDARKYSGIKISANSSPQISISRSSSRSNQDDFDDPDFVCPFDVDDDDMTDYGSRPESFDKGHICGAAEHGGLFPIRKSQDAAVGALVHLLKKAPPLRQDISGSTDITQASRLETLYYNIHDPNQVSKEPSPASVMSSGLMSRKTTTDALEEFQGYREMKNLLLLQRTMPQTDAA